MIIPVRCATCGKVIADKWMSYKAKTSHLTASDDVPDNTGKTPRGRILDELGLHRICCRVVMMTHVDLLTFV